jgi:hypothetical protein
MISNKDANAAFNRITSGMQEWKDLWKAQEELKKLKAKHAGNEFHFRRTLDAAQSRLDVAREITNRLEPQVRERAELAANNTKVLFLSATPFAAHKNLRYVNGYLFDWGNEITYEQLSNGPSRVDPESRFMLDNFGSLYQWQRHKLSEKKDKNPDAVAMQEVEFSERLMAAGAVSGRAINSEQDYSREFPLVTGFNREEFNRSFNEIFTYGDDAKYPRLRNPAYKVFKEYNYATQLFESIKTSMAIDRIKKHLALGRKVVIFHRRQQSNVTPPFRTILETAKKDADAVLAFPDQHGDDAKKKAVETLEQVERFEQENSAILAYEQTLDYSSAVSQIQNAFPDQTVFFSGKKEHKKLKSKAVTSFNDDNSGKDIIMIQEDAGKEGISLHDTTGAHQRVLMSLSMPVSTITALQIEGRIYRIGQLSDAVFEYPVLGLDLETAYFGQNLNKRLSTTENLAVGKQARDLIRSFAEGVLFHSSADDPSAEQGKGGKEFDKKASSNLSLFEKAKLVYATNQRKQGRRDQRQGVDYFATPEPIGQKMVEWSRFKPGEHGLEPSAGHGAIAMWFPNTISTTAVEPSYELFSKLSGRAEGANKRVLNQNFEDLNIINKYHAVVMNPPFGSGGKTAMDHIEKAFKHLHDGGRIVALVPEGGAMQKRLDAFLYGEDDKGRNINPDAHLRMEVSLPNVAFVQAGTSVKTKIIIIDKAKSVPDDVTLESRTIDLNYAESINDLFDEIEDLDVPNRIPVPKQAELEPVAKPAAANNAPVGDGSLIDVKQHTHTKTGALMHVGNIKVKVSSEEYGRIAGIAKKHNGMYNRYLKGFAFKTAEAVQAFANEVNAGDGKTTRESLLKDVKDAWEDLRTPEDEDPDRIVPMGFGFSTGLAKKHLRLYEAVAKLAADYVKQFGDDFTSFLLSIPEDIREYFSDKYIRQAYEGQQLTEDDFELKGRNRDGATDLANLILNGKINYGRAMEIVEGFPVSKWMKEASINRINEIIDRTMDDELSVNEDDPGPGIEEDEEETFEEPQGERADTYRDRLDAFAQNVPNDRVVKEYLSGLNIERNYGEGPQNNQDYFMQELQPAFDHGARIIETAQALFGRNWVLPTLDYIKNARVDASVRALMYVSLDNALDQQYKENPTAELAKLKRTAFVESQAFAHELSLGMNYQKLRNVAKWGVDGSEVTGGIFTPTEGANRKKVGDAATAKEDEVNKQADREAKGEAIPVEDTKTAGAPQERPKSPKSSWKQAASKSSALRDKLALIKENFKKLKC